MREKYMLALANLVNGAELGYEDRSSIPQYKKDIEDYVDSLEKVNKEYEEVIDKAIKLIEDTYYSKNTTDIDSIVLSSDKLIKVREILKEVE